MTREIFLARLGGGGLPEFVSRMVSHSRIPGAHRTLTPTGGLEMERTAPFRFAVDDPKDYDWTLSGRLGKPMRKVRIEEKELLAICLVDMRPSLLFGATRTKREFAIEAAATVGLAAIASGDRALIAELAPDAPLPNLTGTRRTELLVTQALHLWEAPRAAESFDIAQAVYRIARDAPRRTSIFLFSDWIFPPDAMQPRETLANQRPYREAAEALNMLALDREVCMVTIHDIRDRQIPPGAWRVRAHPGSASAVLNGGAKRSAQKIREKLLAERCAWLAQLNAIGIDSCDLETTEDFSYIERLMQFFAERQR